MKALRRKIETSILLLVLALGTFVAGGPRYVRAEANADPSDGASEPVDRSQWVLKESAQAIAKARKVLGLPEEKSDGLSATLVTLEEDNTPYLSDQLIGRPLWHVVVRDWPLELKSAGAGYKDQYVRTFDIFLDPADGRVLKVKSRWPEGAVPLLTDPTPAAAADQMWRSGREVYHGFPTHDPEVSFLDALESLKRSGKRPLIARQIIGRFVMQSRMGREPKAVWAITLRGVPPKPRHQRYGSRGEPWYQYRYIVDGETGRRISGSSTPDPVIHPPKNGD